MLKKLPEVEVTAIFAVWKSIWSVKYDSSLKFKGFVEVLSDICRD